VSITLAEASNDPAAGLVHLKLFRGPGGAKPKGWRCTVFAGGLFGTCKSPGRIFHWAGAE
jgi:hypothetical protein